MLYVGERGVQRCQDGIRTFSNYNAVRNDFFFLSAWCGDRGKATCNIRILYVAGEAVLCATAAVGVFFDSPRACSS